MLQTLSECAVTLKMIHLKRVKTKHSVWKHSTPTELVLYFILFLFKGPEFIQFLQQEYLPSLHVSPEISQVIMETLNGFLMENPVLSLFYKIKKVIINL